MERLIAGLAGTAWQKFAILNAPVAAAGVPMTEERGSDLLYLLKHVAWRLAQAAAVAAVVFLTITLVTSRRPGMEPKEIDAMRRDLRSLVLAEEAYFAEQGRYGGIEMLKERYFTPDPAVSLVVKPAGTTGWSATATYAKSLHRCAVYVGSVPPPRPGATEGAPVCW